MLFLLHKFLYLMQIVLFLIGRQRTRLPAFVYTACQYVFYRTSFHIRLFYVTGQMDGQDTWFVESAVSSYLYSEIITFTLNQEAGTISHNLALASAKRFVTEKFPLDCTRSLYLVLEIFHGDVCGVQKYPPKQAPKPECKISLSEYNIILSKNIHLKMITLF